MKQSLVEVLSFHDAAYPSGTTYFSKFKDLDEPFRSEVLAINALLHWIDDVSDDPSQNHVSRLEEYELFKDAFQAAVHGNEPSVILNELLKRAQGIVLPAALGKNALSRAQSLGLILQASQKVWNEHKIKNFEDYFELFEILKAISQWERKVQFETLSELELFINKKFLLIVKVFEPVVSQHSARDLQNQLRHEFFCLMKAMQVVNVLMDVEEDWQARQVWIPKEFILQKDLDLIHQRAPNIEKSGATRMLDLADRQLGEIQILWDESTVGIQESRFFRGLHEIYLALKKYLLGREP